jgi:hypothetical protein
MKIEKSEAFDSKSVRILLFLPTNTNTPKSRKIREKPFSLQFKYLGQIFLENKEK